MWMVPFLMSYITLSQFDALEFRQSMLLISKLKEQK